MNTYSISMSKAITESGSSATKAKSGKSEDSFIDMIKSASTKSTFDKSNQVANEEKDFEGKKIDVSPEEDVQASKDNDETSDLAALLVNAAVVFDPVQLAKMVKISPEASADTSVKEQSNTIQSAILETDTNLQGLQTLLAQTETAEMQIGEKVPLTYAAKVLSEGEEKNSPQPLLKQDIAANPLADSTNAVVGTKQGALAGEQNQEGTLSQEQEGMDSNALAAVDLPSVQTDGANDSKITIKVGDTALDASWKQAAEEIGNMIVEKVNQNVQKVNIKLTPKELGEIDVEFLINNGKISVSLHCSNEGTKSLLSANLDSLSKVVQSSLMQEANVSINYDKTDGQNTNNENFDGRGNGHYQDNSQNKKQEKDQADLDFLQRLRLGIETIDDAEV
ncbi:MAG: flagellar hook-length control protein FliK [Anaerotignum sp.]|nr:flagellar hook-length control protein FliK [Anaerotignum sp.]